MKPEEKAKELIYKFIPLTDGKDAYKCAIIAAEEVIHEIKGEDSKSPEFWNEVLNYLKSKL